MVTRHGRAEPRASGGSWSEVKEEARPQAETGDMSAMGHPVPEARSAR
jgi:hypothetical protein